MEAKTTKEFMGTDWQADLETVQISLLQSTISENKLVQKQRQRRNSPVSVSGIPKTHISALLTESSSLLLFPGGHIARQQYSRLWTGKLSLSRESDRERELINFNLEDTTNDSAEYVSVLEYEQDSALLSIQISVHNVTWQNFHSKRASDAKLVDMVMTEQPSKPC